jgi:sortase A
MAPGRIRGALGFVFGAWRIRPRSKRILSALSVILALSGAGMLTFPFFTDLYSSRVQDRLATEFASPEFRSDYRLGAIEEGEVLTRIRIPSIAVDALIVEGTDARSLRAGAGHYSHTALPCEGGNVGIAGHRNTYGEPFNRLDELRVGDEIYLITPERSCTYRVVLGPDGKRRPHRWSASWITHPRDGAVLLPQGDGHLLTLTTCHPKRSTAERLIVRAELV